MAERLVFCVWKGGKQIGAIHFRWGAYTLSIYQCGLDIANGLKKYGYDKTCTVNETYQILINVLEDIRTDIDHVGSDKTFELCIHTHGGVSSTDWDIAESLGLKFNKENVSASDGILIIDEDHVEDALSNAEQIEDIYLDDEYLTNNLYSEMTEDEVLDIDPKIRIDEIPMISSFPFDWETLTSPEFGELDNIIRWMLSIDHNNFILGRLDGGTIVTIFC